MNILAVIPARGGSKGIPRKNVRIMHGKPLICYAIENAHSCHQITDIAVSSDDEEILNIARKYSVTPIQRNQELANDTATLDPVVYDTVKQMEKLNDTRYDIVITMQPTSPLLKSETLEQAIDAFLKDDKDSYISVVNRAHLTWSKTDAGYKPNYIERLNRQKLPATYFETGAFFISKRSCVTPSSRLGSKISVFEISDDESADIDSPSDWQLCENILNRKRIVFRCDGHKLLGMGHIYHCLTLAYHFTGHDIMFVTKAEFHEGLEKLQSSYMPVTTINDDMDFFNFLKGWNADIVVNDCLDTTTEYIKTLKKIVKRVITIEDLGEGSKYADAVINALYYKEAMGNNYYFGEDYHCLKDEFLTAKPKDFSSDVTEVLVLFGGTDPSNLTEKIYNSIPKFHAQYPKIHFTIITGPGYNKPKSIVSNTMLNIEVFSNVKRISEFMEKADLAFTSQGRTVFELASLGVPSIVLAQNAREQMHTFAQMQNGFVNLGLGKNISNETIEKTFNWLVDTPQIREEMRELMLKHDLKKGVKRISDIIIGDD